MTGPLKQQSGPQLVDSRTNSQRRNRKRKETHQLHDGVKREIAAAYPRFTQSSELTANRSGAARMAVVDIKIEQFEKRLSALELRLGPNTERSMLGLARRAGASEVA